MSDVKCRNCIFYTECGPYNHVCVSNPPQAINGRGDSAFPSVKGNNWCEQFLFEN